MFAFSYTRVSESRSRVPICWSLFHGIERNTPAFSHASHRRRPPPPSSVQIDRRHVVLNDLQEAFDQATRAYKTQVGDGLAWSKITQALNRILDRTTGWTYQWKTDVHQTLLSAFAEDLRNLAKDPELAVRSLASSATRLAHTER